MRSISSASLLAIGAFAAACGGGDLSAKGAIEENAQAVCAGAFRCMSSYPAGFPIPFEGLFGTSASACTTMFNRDAAAVQAAVDAGRIEYNSADAEACIEFGEGLSCTDFWGNLFDEMPPSPAACDTAFIGKVAIGGMCTISLECAGADSTCDDATNTCEM
jgi:hypothetical protein